MAFCDHKLPQRLNEEYGRSAMVKKSVQKYFLKKKEKSNRKNKLLNHVT